MTRKWDVEAARKLKDDRGLTYAEIAAVISIPKSTVERNLRKYRVERNNLQTKAESTTPYDLPSRHGGQFAKRRYLGPLTSKASRTLSNRELFDSYMSAEFIEWMIVNEPRSFLDAWTRLQPKDMQIGLTGNISMQLSPYDVRIVEIEQVVSNGLSAPAQIRRIREILGIDKVTDLLLGCDGEQQEQSIEAEGGMAGAEEDRVLREPPIPI